jgi:predicted acylesterase/phospholipase RssA
MAPSDLPRPKRRALLFSGGGFRVLTFCSFHCLVDLSSVTLVGGVSAGGVIALFTVLGLCTAEMRSVAAAMHVGDFWSRWSDFSGCLTRLALLEESTFFEAITQILSLLGLPPASTLSQLRTLTGRTLRLFACSLRGRTLTSFDADSHPDLQLRVALCAGMAVPFVFEPVSIGGDLYFDAGAVNNLPVHLMGNPAELMALRVRPDSQSSSSLAGRLATAGFLRMNFYMQTGLAVAAGTLFCLNAADASGEKNMFSPRDFDASVRLGAFALLARILVLQIVGLFVVLVGLKESTTGR